ncbi:hypothetical protein I552_1919 [Mycobacterium xenopi 3993]|nr:hypothetical protein I552_1919 [Mycobacterium xenopi 3993]
MPVQRVTSQTVADAVANGRRRQRRSPRYAGQAPNAAAAGTPCAR